MACARFLTKYGLRVDLRLVFVSRPVNYPAVPVGFVCRRCAWHRSHLLLGDILAGLPLELVDANPAGRSRERDQAGVGHLHGEAVYPGARDIRLRHARDRGVFVR